MFLRPRQSSVRMANKTQWILELVDRLTAPMKEVIGAANKAADAVEDVGQEAEESKSALEEMSAIDLFAVADSVESLANQFEQINAPGAAFNASLKEVEAIAGLTGDALDELGQKGRQTAKDFGGDASAMLESYKGILGKLGPDIAQNDEALDLMGRNVATLSKTMKNDTVGAMNALTGSMLQFGSDIEDPMAMAHLMTEQMNIMAASSKEGSAEVPLIAQSIKQAGKAADNANISFAETNAVIQAMGKGTIYGSEAGIGFRNMLGKMAGEDVIPKAALEKIQALGINYDIVSDKSIPFIERLKELKKAQADATLIAQIFGTENQNAVNTILDNIEYIEELQEKIVGTNTATEQAEVIMSGYTETMSRVSAWFTDLKIGMFDITSSIAPFIDGLSGAVMVMANMANARKGILLLFNTLKTMPWIGKVVAMGSAIVKGAFAGMTFAAKGLGVAIANIPILGWIAALIAGLIALGAYFWKTSATFRGVLMGVWNFIKTAFTGYYEFIKQVMEGIWHLIKGVFNPKNWFDSDYSFSEGFDKVLNAAKDYGTKLAKSFAEGRAEGEESYYREHPEEDPEFKKKEEKLAQLKSQYEALDGRTDKDAQAQRANIRAMMENIQEGSTRSLAINNVSPKLSPTDLSPKPTGGSAGGNTSGGSGSSSIKNITQRIDMKNYFTISSGGSRSEIDSVAEKVVKALNERLRDGMIAVS